MLSDKQILEAMEQGNIIIEPFDARQLGTNSYDCRLGEWFFAQDEASQHVRLFSEDMRALWGEPRKAIKGEIPVRPGEIILAHTMEIIGGRNGFLTNLHTRSTVARSCLGVHLQAGIGDVLYINKWTLEVHNFSRNTIWLPVSGRIGQFTFEYVGKTLKNYSGHYMQQEEWNPYCMLPSAKPDWAVEEYREQVTTPLAKAQGLSGPSFVKKEA